MKLLWCVLLLGFGLAISAESASTEKTDPLTGLPLYSAIAEGAGPIKLPEIRICKSKMEANRYTVHDAKMDATLAWCVAHLQGFKQTHAYSNGRSQNAFYNADGTLLVSVTSIPGKPGENSRTGSISYKKFTPGISEKTILSVKDQNIVCPP
jgi:hypothetical protein